MGWEILNPHKSFSIQFINHLLVVVSVFVLLCCNSAIQGVNSQSLSTEELNSCVYLITQYGSSIGQNSAGICNSGNFICGMGTDNQYHVLQIKFQNTIYQPTGTPPAITQFTFPQVTLIDIKASIYNYYDWNKDTLTLMKDLPLVTEISILQDNTILAIPSDFAVGKPLLKKFSLLSSSNITTFNFNGFNNSAIEKIDLIGSYVSSYIVDPNVYLGNFQQANLYLYNAPAQTIVFSSQSFPNLYNLFFTSSKGSARVNILVNLKIVNFIGQMMNPDETGSIVPTFMYPEYIKGLTLGGRNSVLPDLALFSNLNHFEVQYTQITSYPYNFYPSKLQSLNFGNNKIKFIPTIPFPSTLFWANFAYNDISGTIPYSIMVNNPVMTLDVYGNSNITGVLGNEWCSLKGLQIQSTGITKIPDCWWCYENNNIFTTTLTRPATLNCQIQIDSNSVLSRDGVITVSGNNLGWATNIGPNARLLVPNKMIQFNVDLTQGYQQDLTIGLLPNATPEFTINVSFKEVGFHVQTVGSSSYSIETYNYVIGFGFWIDEFLPEVTMNRNIPCLSPTYNNVSKKISCYFSYPPVGDQMIFVENQYHSYNLQAHIIKNKFMTSFLLDPIYPPKGIVMYGYFGDNPQLSDGYVTLEWSEMANCSFTKINSSYIRCEFDQQPTPGHKNLRLYLNQIQTGMAYLYFPEAPPSYTACMNLTNNCNNRGNCVDGQCVCDPGWTDNCKLQSVLAPNVDFVKDGTNPSAVFSYGDYIFAFNMIAIQELDVDDNIIKELNTTTWTYVNQSTPTLTSVAYRLEQSMETKPNFTLLNVVSLIEFSDQSRMVQFAGDTLQLGAGSIKISVEITNWPFNTTISHLRVVFSTKINNEQFVTGCDNSTIAIESLQNAIGGGSLQYLRVVQGNVQFFGRFLDYSVADGRKVSSATQLMNLTKIDDKESMATIGINLPICQVCLLDPDFSALVVDNDSYGYCGGQDDKKNWKIIVGVVVGVVGAVALGVIIFAILKKNRFYFVLKGKNSEEVKLQSTYKNDI